MRANAAQLLLMRRGKFLQRLLAPLRQCEIYLAAIGTVVFAHDKTLFYEAVDQPDRAVMTDLQALGQFFDRNLPPRRQTFDGEQSLVLLRRHPRAMRCFLAEAEKLPERITQVCQCFIFRLTDVHDVPIATESRARIQQISVFKRVSCSRSRWLPADWLSAQGECRAATFIEHSFASECVS